MTGIEINLIYMTYSHLEMPLFFFKEILLRCQCTTHGSVLRPLQTGDQTRYTSLSACQVSYLLGEAWIQNFLHSASVNVIKEGLLPLNVGCGDPAPPLPPSCSVPKGWAHPGIHVVFPSPAQAWDFSLKPEAQPRCFSWPSRHPHHIWYPPCLCSPHWHNHSRQKTEQAGESLSCSGPWMPRCEQ